MSPLRTLSLGLLRVKIFFFFFLHTKETKNRRQTKRVHSFANFVPSSSSCGTHSSSFSLHTKETKYRRQTKRVHSFANFVSWSSSCEKIFFFFFTKKTKYRRQTKRDRVKIGIISITFLESVHV